MPHKTTQVKCSICEWNNINIEKKKKKSNNAKSRKKDERVKTWDGSAEERISSNAAKRSALGSCKLPCMEMGGMKMSIMNLFTWMVYTWNLSSLSFYRVNMWPTPTNPGTSAIFHKLSYWFYPKVLLAIIWHQNHDSIYYISMEMTLCDPNHSICLQKFNVRKWWLQFTFYIDINAEKSWECIIWCTKQ